MRKIKINKKDLDNFREFIDKKGIELKVSGDIFWCSVYFNSSSAVYLNWDTDKMSKEEIKLLVGMLNVLVKDCELVYGR